MDRFKRLTFGLLLVVWSITPVIILSLATFCADTCSSHPFLLLGPLAFWSVSALFMFCYTQDKLYKAESIESLTCTIFLGLVSIGVSSASVLGSPLNLPATLSPDGGHADLPSLKTLEGNDRTLWVAAIDLAQGAIKDGTDREHRLGLIDSAMRSIFLDGDEGSFARSLQPLDSLHVYALSGTKHFEWSNELAGEGREDLRRDIVMNLRNSLAEKLTAFEEPSESSALMEFLSHTVCSEIRAYPGKFHQVRVILFSTWEQLAGLQPGAEALAFQEINRCLVEDRPPASVLAFCLPALGTTQGMGMGCGTAMHALHSYLPESQLQEMSLLAYDQLSPAQKMVSFESLYKIPLEPLSLSMKYCPNSRTDSPSSKLNLPYLDSGDRAYLRLRPLSGEASRLRLEVMADKRASYLSLAEGEDFKALDPRQNTVNLRLADHFEVPRDRDFELVVAIPRQAALYRVRLILMPSLTRGSLLALFFIAVVIHLFPVPVAIRILVRRHHDQLKRARKPAPLP